MYWGSRGKKQRWAQGYAEVKYDEEEEEEELKGIYGLPTYNPKDYNNKETWLTARG